MAVNYYGGMPGGSATNGHGQPNSPNDVATSTGRYDVNVTPNRMCYPWHQGCSLGTVEEEYQSWSYPGQGRNSCNSFMYSLVALKPHSAIHRREVGGMCKRSIANSSVQKINLFISHKGVTLHYYHVLSSTVKSLFLPKFIVALCCFQDSIFYR